MHRLLYEKPLFRKQNSHRKPLLLYGKVGKTWLLKTFRNREYELFSRSKRGEPPLEIAADDRCPSSRIARHQISPFPPTGNEFG